MKRNAWWLCAVLLFGISCSTQQEVVVVEKPVAPQTNPLEDLLKRCEQDLNKAADVIVEKKLIQNLTHLQRMNRGGGRYYALERESLSMMINQLVSQKYSECILVNGSGTIIYSMYNDAVFGKQAARLEQTVLPRIYAESSRGNSYVSETTEFPPLSGTHVIFVSVPVVENGKVIGVLTAALDIRQIEGLFPRGTKIVNGNGQYVLHPDREQMAAGKKISTQISLSEEQMTKASQCNYLNVHWFIISGS